MKTVGGFTLFTCDKNDKDDETLELTKVVVTNGSNLDLTFDSL